MKGVNMVKVRNVKSDPRWAKPKDGIHNSWIDYWNGYSLNYVPYNCPCCGKTMQENGGAVGGHVRKAANPHGDVFVTPICDVYNKTFKESKTYDIEFYVEEDMLIHANYLKLKESNDYLDPLTLKMAGLTRCFIARKIK